MKSSHNVTNPSAVAARALTKPIIPMALLRGRKVKTLCVCGKILTLVAARIMAGLPPLQEKLHPNQQKIDVVDDEKIDGKDFAKLRAGKKPDVKKEEVEIEEESHQSKTTMKHIPKTHTCLKHNFTL